jgi:hypothetical protein
VWILGRLWQRATDGFRHRFSDLLPCQRRRKRVPQIGLDVNVSIFTEVEITIIKAPAV